MGERLLSGVDPKRRDAPITQTRLRLRQRQSVTGGLHAVRLAGVRIRQAAGAEMPDVETLWLIELRELTVLLDAVGLTLTWEQQCTASHQATASALLQSFRTYSVVIARQIGTQALDELITAHQLWSDLYRCF